MRSSLAIVLDHGPSSHKSNDGERKIDVRSKKLYRIDIQFLSGQQERYRDKHRIRKTRYARESIYADSLGW